MRRGRLYDSLVTHTHLSINTYIHTHTYTYQHQLFFKIQVNNLVAERCCKNALFLDATQSCEPLILSKTEDSAILNSTWIKVGHFVTTAKFKMTVLYTKVVLHQL